MSAWTLSLSMDKVGLSSRKAGKPLEWLLSADDPKPRKRSDGVEGSRGNEG